MHSDLNSDEVQEYILDMLQQLADMAEARELVQFSTAISAILAAHGGKRHRWEA